ncbi:FMN reductase [Bogoriella caseilytica]|uniref:LLM-partnered FMN reductase n=1 Tax=Bogoriella caseilytica TaxID=56055 RepID=A0A3N2BER7_9MICO|nr:FMN reductase [Bogoriella caseilytica]ROR73748.1 LLM-partnered FMN reductase [Bogoriella caseilytica]
MVAGESGATRRSLVAVSAGLGQPSSTRMLAERLLGGTSDALAEQGVGVDTEIVELRGHAHAIVDAMLTGFASGELDEVLGRVTAADGLILVTPVFTTTYSGLFKSFLDILDHDALRGVPVVLGATGGTARHSLALEYSLRPLLTYLRAEVVTTSVFAATEDWAGTDAGPSPKSHHDAAQTEGLPRRIHRAGRELADRVAANPVRQSGDLFDGTPDFGQMLGQLGH